MKTSNVSIELLWVGLDKDGNNVSVMEPCVKNTMRLLKVYQPKGG